MLRSEAITIIKRGLGFRQTQDAAIIAALKQAQRELELGKTLPEWLRVFVTTLITPGSGVVTMPEGFIRLSDEMPVYYVTTEGALVMLPHRMNDEAFDAYMAGESFTEPEANTYPQVFILRSKTQGVLYPIPTVTTLTTIVIPCYLKADVLDSDIENLWLEHAPDYLIGIAGGIVAGQLRDVGAAQVFTSQAQRGQRALIGDIVEDELAGRPLMMGRNN